MDTRASLSGALELVTRQFPLLVDASEAIGPLVEIRELDASDIGALDSLPEIEDYELFVEIPDARSLAADSIRPTRFDSLEVFFAEHGSIGIDLRQTGQLRIRIDFAAPADSRKANEPIAFDRLSSADDRIRLLESILQTALSAGGGSAAANTGAIARQLIKDRPATHGYRPFGEAGSFRFEILAADDEAGINHVVALLPPKQERAALTALFLQIVGNLPAVEKWRARLFGDKNRMRGILSRLPQVAGHVSYGNTAARVAQLIELENRDYNGWRVELQKAVISQRLLRQVIEGPVSLSCKRFSVKWVNLRRWLVSAAELSPPDNDTWSENFIEVQRSSRGRVELYLSIGDSLPRQAIVRNLQQVLAAHIKSAV